MWSLRCEAMPLQIAGTENNSAPRPSYRRGGGKGERGRARWIHLWILYTTRRESSSHTCTCVLKTRYIKLHTNRLMNIFTDVHIGMVTQMGMSLIGLFCVPRFFEREKNACRDSTRLALGAWNPNFHRAQVPDNWGKWVRDEGAHLAHYYCSRFYYINKK